MAVQCACEMAATGCANVGSEVLLAVGQRCKDRVAVIRKEAITGLAQVFKHNVAEQWLASQGDDEDDDFLESGNDDDADGTCHRRVFTTQSQTTPLATLTFSRFKIRLYFVSTELMILFGSGISARWCVGQAMHERLGWIPSLVLKTFNIIDSELRGRVLQLLDEILLPKSLTTKSRAKALLYIFANLDPTAKGILGRIFAMRQRVQSVVCNFAEDPQDEEARVICDFHNLDNPCLSTRT